MSLDPQLLPIEAALIALARSPNAKHIQMQARAMLGTFLATLTPGQPSDEHLSEQIEAASRSGNGPRSLALILLRILPFEGVLPSKEEDALIEIRTLAAIERGAGDIFGKLVDKKRQTFEQIASLRAHHSSVIDKLGVVASPPRTPRPLLTMRQDILSALNAKSNVGYLAPFGGREFAVGAESILAALDDLTGAVDHSFMARIQTTRDQIAKLQGWGSENRTFLTTGFLRPFVESVLAALSTLETTAIQRAACRIEPRSTTLEKRYALDEDRIVAVTIPLTNHGPGIAINVVIEVRTTEAALSNESYRIGDIRPGDFALTVDLVPQRNLKRLQLDLEISWEIVGSTKPEKSSVSIVVSAQSTEINWDRLSRLDPYNSNIAEGADFIGRGDKLTALTARLAKDRMQSSYITGQKRVGKSSLALACLARAKQDQNVQTLYLEYGEFAHTDPAQTMKRLGERIYHFLIGFIPYPQITSVPDFAGTLAPLAMLADQLLRVTPGTKFVITIDEFDEIPVELYHAGALAETFFSNIRTISGKKNIAFMLVGGENMPFIVAAQGDQLNKFVRESLTYFARVEDWQDFTQLITHPVANTGINWHTSAINAVFDLTLGHPYYAKILCARVFSRAVAEKDTDITSLEVTKAYRQLVSDLDVNSFAHLWRDGIQGSRAETESTAQMRCRLLVALGRLVRSNASLDFESVTKAATELGLRRHEVQPLLADFTMRGIFEEKAKHFSITIPLFRDWMVSSGVTRIIANTLSDEIAAQAQAASDRAYVRDGEIATLTDAWNSYRGRKLSVGDVRAWLEQFGGFRQQRMAFRLLQALRFMSEVEIREKLRVAHSLVLKTVPEFARKARTDRRKDIVVTYVDGPAKSGQYYASRYAEENLLSSKSVVELGSFAKQLEQIEHEAGQSANGIVIVDDLVGTGRTLIDRVGAFLARERDAILGRNASVVVVVLTSTKEGESNLREALSRELDVKIDLRVCETLAPSNFAFDPSNSIWADAAERSEARVMCAELGAKLVSAAPLGFGDQGLLLVFPQTCPNNTLPVLHAEKKNLWRALFPRPRN